MTHESYYTAINTFLQLNSGSKSWRMSHDNFSIIYRRGTIWRWGLYYQIYRFLH